MLHVGMILGKSCYRRDSGGKRYVTCRHDSAGAKSCYM